jgi:hypothetical protein
MDEEEKFDRCIGKEATGEEKERMGRQAVVLIRAKGGARRNRMEKRTHALDDGHPSSDRIADQQQAQAPIRRGAARSQPSAGAVLTAVTPLEA